MPRLPLRRLLVLASLGALLAAPALAKTYRWVDEGGTHHFTDRAEEVPPRYRYQLEDSYVGEPSEAGASRFVVVPGIDGPGREGEPVKPIDEDAYEAAARDALASGNTRSFAAGMPDRGEILEAGAPIIGAAILGFLLVLAIALAIAVFILKLACFFCGESWGGFGKGFGVVLTQTLGAVGLGLLIGLLAPQGLSGTEVHAGQFAVGFVLNAAILRAMLLDSFPKALAVNAVAMLIQLVIGLVLGLAVAAAFGVVALG